MVANDGAGDHIDDVFGDIGGEIGEAFEMACGSHDLYQDIQFLGAEMCAVACFGEQVSVKLVDDVVSGADLACE